jgi:Trypsin-co-occurring domain 2
MSDFTGVSDVIEAIKQEIRAAQQVVIGEPRLELVEVILEINAVVTRSAAGGVKAEIMTLSLGPSIEAGFGGKQSQKITISLQPPERVITQSSLDLSKLDLAKTILTLRRELREGLAKEPVLLPNKLDIEMHFAVQKHTETQLGLKLVFIEIGPKATFSSEYIHKVSLRFQTPDLPV